MQITCYSVSESFMYLHLHLTELGLTAGLLTCKQIAGEV